MPIDLSSHFPHMRPIRSAPTLFRINGCGIGLYGRRELDRETQTYIATSCICLVFIPILALSAYRVARAAGGGWYFLGRERLSPFAKLWNLLLLGGVGLACAIGGWNSYTHSPEYIAKNHLKQARQYAGE